MDGWLVSGLVGRLVDGWFIGWVGGLVDGWLASGLVG